MTDSIMPHRPKKKKTDPPYFWCSSFFGVPCFCAFFFLCVAFSCLIIFISVFLLLALFIFGLLLFFAPLLLCLLVSPLLLFSLPFFLSSSFLFYSSSLQLCVFLFFSVLLFPASSVCSNLLFFCVCFSLLTFSCLFPLFS